MCYFTQRWSVTAAAIVRLCVKLRLFLHFVPHTQYSCTYPSGYRCCGFSTLTFCEWHFVLLLAHCKIHQTSCVNELVTLMTLGTKHGDNSLPTITDRKCIKSIGHQITTNFSSFCHIQQIRFITKICAYHWQQLFLYIQCWTTAKQNQVSIHISYHSVSKHIQTYQ